MAMTMLMILVLSFAFLNMLIMLAIPNYPTKKSVTKARQILRIIPYNLSHICHAMFCKMKKSENK